jgi:hypothetical protein
VTEVVVAGFAPISDSIAYCSPSRGTQSSAKPRADCGSAAWLSTADSAADYAATPHTNGTSNRAASSVQASTIQEEQRSVFYITKRV